MGNIAEGLQLATTQAMETIKFPCRAERKLDGVRLMLLDGRFYTRKGKEVSLPKTTKHMRNMVGVMLDMEVTLESGKVEDRATVSGLINSAMKGGTIDEDLLWFNVFDGMPSDLYRARSSVDCLKERLHFVNNYIDMCPNPRFRKIPYSDVTTQHALEAMYQGTTLRGYEGLVTKHYDDKYIFKRSKEWARFKPVRTADLKCTGVVEGKGKYAGMIGALRLEDMLDEEFVVVNVGSGMTDFDRALPHDRFVGKVIEVKYSHITKAKDAIYPSLNQPRFVMVREDK